MRSPVQYGGLKFTAAVRLQIRKVLCLYTAMVLNLSPSRFFRAISAVLLRDAVPLTHCEKFHQACAVGDTLPKNAFLKRMVSLMCGCARDCGSNSQCGGFARGPVRTRGFAGNPLLTARATAILRTGV